MQKKTKIITSLILAMILAIGFGVVILFGIGWVYTLIGFESFTEPRNQESIILLTDGTPIVDCQIYGGRSTRKIVHHTLDGKAFTFKKNEFARSLTFLAQREADNSQTSFYLPPRKRIENVSGNQETRDVWYFVHDGNLEGKAYFVGYERASNQCIGYIGRRGKTSEIPPQSDWFPYDGRNFSKSGPNIAMINSHFDPESGYPSRFGILPFWQILLLSNDEILKVDLREGAVNAWMKFRGLISGNPLGLQYSPFNMIGDEQEKTLYAFRTNDSVHILDSSGKEITKYIIPEKLRDGNISFAKIDADRAFIEYSRRNQKGEIPEELYWINPEGKILRQEEITFQQNLPLKYPSPNDPDSYERLVMESSLPPCLNTYMISVSTPQDYIARGKEPDYSSALRRSFSESYLSMMITLTFSALLSYFCYRRQRRYALPWTWVWVGFVFLCGVPGFLGYRFHRRWAVLDDCPRCTKNVPRDREACANCGASFPLPERKGIEVFA
jgi:hypothetical protein